MTATTTTPPTSLEELLAQRLMKPQRHRLLQGFPAAPSMAPAVAPLPERIDVDGTWGAAELPTRSLDGSVTDPRFREAKATLLHLGPQWTPPTRPPPPTKPPTTPKPALPWQKAPPTKPPLTPEQQEARWAEVLKSSEASWHVRKARADGVIARGDRSAAAVVDVDRARKLIVGVIPHTQCTPRKDGCGFCTFPHDKVDGSSRAAVVESVQFEIEKLLQRESNHLEGRSVSALYFGGGTANLADAASINGLFHTLKSGGLRFNDAEVSLEGVPALFTSFLDAPLRMLEKLPVRRRRISMGVQTFDDFMLEEMGRQSFGDHKLIRKLIGKCRKMDIGVSGDFLFNVPGQTLAQMSRDVDTAVDLGFDQICLYSLVLYKGLGTLWSHDPAKVAQVPSNELGCERWLTLREQLLRAGYVQTTVTNFERKDLAAADRFQYEPLGFSPEDVDLLGFGPLSISVLCDFPKQRGIKLVRRKDLRQPPWTEADLAHVYSAADLRVLVVTRAMAKLGLERDVYTKLFSTDVVNDFPQATQLLLNAGLIDIDEAEICLTPRGMFYSDTVVSLFAAEQRSEQPGALGLHTADLLREPVRPGDHFIGMG